MPDIRRISTPLYWTVTAALFAAAIVVSVRYTPVEATMGQAQKIFYLHLPTAINTFLACAVAFVAGVGYLWQRRRMWDDLGVAAARTAVVLGTVVLATGMIWGRSAWNAWWTWSPRLTFSLVLWLLYVVYLVLRPSILSPHRRALVGAVYLVVAFLDVPLVYLSVRLMDDIHPTSVSLAPAMLRTLLLWFVPMTMLTVGLIAAGYQLQARQSAGAEEAEAPAGAVAGEAGGSV